MGKICMYTVLFAGLFMGEVTAQEQSRTDKPRSPRQLAVMYNFAHIGHNLSLDYRHYFGRHALVGGLKYHLATTIRNGNSRFDGFRFNSLYRSVPGSAVAANFRNKIGINLGYIFQLKKAKSWLSPYLFYQLQSTFSLNAYSKLYQAGSFTVFENALGLGMQPVLYKRLHLDVGAGVGPVFFYDETGPITAPRPVEEPVWTRERIILLRIGVFYRLNKP